jgi:hypothetical protein
MQAALVQPADENVGTSTSEKKLNFLADPLVATNIKA